jgi:hypothetical protein
MEEAVSGDSAGRMMEEAVSGDRAGRGDGGGSGELG